jgi:hypothetical protein
MRANCLTSALTNEVCESVRIIPSSPRRGGCASNKMSRSYRSGADGVVAHNASFGVHSRDMPCEGPPRPLQIRWLRTIFLMSRPPLLCEEGIIRTDSHFIAAPASYGTSMIGACQNAAFCPVGSRTVI